jgi:peptidoglycan-N-acetylglucosamine deacetylase
MIDLTSKIYNFLFPSVTVRVPGDAIHLTFDDGPHPRATSKVLDVLNKFGVKSTFFLLGEQAIRFPQLARDIAAGGHAIGNHAYHHANLAFKQRQFVYREIAAANEAITEASGVTPKLFRPPFGYFGPWTLTIVQSLGMHLVHWSNDSRDFKIDWNEKTLSALVRRIDKGSIILLHDNDATSGKVATFLPAFIAGLRDRGFSFSSLD